MPGGSGLRYGCTLAWVSGGHQCRRAVRDAFSDLFLFSQAAALACKSFQARAAHLCRFKTIEAFALSLTLCETSVEEIESI